MSHAHDPNLSTGLFDPGDKPANHLGKWQSAGGSVDLDPKRGAHTDYDLPRFSLLRRRSTWDKAVALGLFAIGPGFLMQNVGAGQRIAHGGDFTSAFLGHPVTAARAEIVVGIVDGADDLPDTGDGGAGQVEVAVDGGGETLLDGEYSLLLEPRDGVVCESLPGSDAIVVLDLELSAELLDEGLARDVVRAVQQARKEADLHVADRIRLELELPAHVARAVENFRGYVAECGGPSAEKVRRTEGAKRSEHRGPSIEGEENRHRHEGTEGKEAVSFQASAIRRQRSAVWRKAMGRVVFGVGG